MTKIKWYLKQLLPLTYRTTYLEKGSKYYTVWCMWFGQCFNQDIILMKTGH
jgi:hypothetical protein